MNLQKQPNAFDPQGIFKHIFPGSNTTPVQFTPNSNTCCSCLMNLLQPRSVNLSRFKEKNHQTLPTTLSPHISPKKA